MRQFKPTPLKIHSTMSMEGFWKGIVPLLLLLLFSTALHAQKKKVTLIQANQMSFDKARQDVRMVTGSVIFEHDSAFLYCDSAAFNEQGNHVEAFGNVRIRLNDTVNLYGDELVYDGETRIADIQGNVRLVDGKTILETPSLSFDRNTRIGRYNNGGKIRDAQNTLTSDHGYYYLALKRFFFKSNVVLNNPSYTMNSDTLQYHTPTGRAEFYGPTTIVSQENIITCRKGWYNTDKDISSFSRGAGIQNEHRKITSDSLYYDRNTGIGRAYRTVLLIDTVRNILIAGEYALYKEIEGHAMVTDSTLAKFYDGPDTLYLHADTLEAFFDSTSSIKNIEAYYHVKFFRTDLQGMCDSLSWLGNDSTILLNKEPVIWSEDKQMLADTIKLIMKNGEMKEMELINQALIVSLEGLIRYNQLKGKLITGYFSDNELVRMVIEGNAETIYYVKEEDGSLIGLNRAISSDVIIRLEDKEITEIVYIREPSAVLYPIDKVPAGEDRLVGFRWLSHRRPKRPMDVFSW